MHGESEQGAESRHGRKIVLHLNSHNGRHQWNQRSCAQGRVEPDCQRFTHHDLQKIFGGQFGVASLGLIFGTLTMKIQRQRVCLINVIKQFSNPGEEMFINPESNPRDTNSEVPEDTYL